MSYGFNKPQFLKELRPLLWPWIGAVAAGAFISFKPLVEGDGMEALITGIVVYGFLGGLALVATLSFGHELQDRTLPLLLSQPLSRSRLWNQKIIMITGAVFAAVLLEFVLLAAVSGRYWEDGMHYTIRRAFRSEEIFMAGIFLLATVCSCGFWTLFARSVIGGLVFTVAAQFITAVAVALLWGQFRGYDEPFQDPLTFAVIAVAGLLYSGAFFWIGWRKFTRLEVRASQIGEGDSSGVAGSRARIGSRLLASRPNGRVLNLIKKELRLQKAIVQFAVVFVLCWAAVVLLQWLRPAQRLDPLCFVLMCIYAPVTGLLAGCISLGEEKALGMTISQRALPFAAWLQWLLKLGTGGATALTLGVCLPFILFLATSKFGLIHDSRLLNDSWSAIPVLGCISAIMFVIGYWAVALAANTLRAALIAIAGALILLALTFTGLYLATLALGTNGSGPQEHQVVLLLRDTAACAVVVMLGQSFFRFRMAEERRSSLFLYPFTLGVVVLAFSFLTTCYM
jgi:hypothetical protein